jgi:hypothetical protein
MAASGDVFLTLSMSLDGYVAGLSDNVEPLHRWLFGRQGREPPWPRLEHGGGQPRRRRRRHASRRTACATPGVFDRAPCGGQGARRAERAVRRARRGRCGWRGGRSRRRSAGSTRRGLLRWRRSGSRGRNAEVLVRARSWCCGSVARRSARSVIHSSRGSSGSGGGGSRPAREQQRCACRDGAAGDAVGDFTAAVGVELRTSEAPERARVEQHQSLGHRWRLACRIRWISSSAGVSVIE